MDSQLCSPDFLRWISHSTAEKRTNVIQKVILHTIGERRQLKVPNTPLLIQESVLQQATIVQAQKAITACMNSKQFKFGTEHVEAQKILLLAVKRREVILKELHKDDCRHLELEEIDSSPLEVSNLSFGLAESKSPNPNQWFVAIATGGTTVLATDATTADAEGSIRFEKPLRFEEIGPKFKINVCLYSLTNSQNEGQKLKAPSIKTLPAYLKDRMNSCKFLNGQEERIQHFKYIVSSFKPWGSFTITEADFRSSCNSTVKFFETPVRPLLLKQAISLNLSRY